MVKFDYLDCFVYPCLGGFLISVASSLNLFFKGRVTGFSGIVYNLWARDDPNNIWRWSLIYGLLSSSCIMKLAGGDTFFEDQNTFLSSLSIYGFLISGFLVGFGTKIGNSCTSGHGVCGLPRLSIRSFVAVGCFLSSGIGIATLRYYEPFLNEGNLLNKAHNEMYDTTKFMESGYYYMILGLTTIVFIIYSIITILKRKNEGDGYELSDLLTGWMTGFVFGLGLSISGMVKRQKVIGFLTMSKDWDPSLIFVLGVSVIMNFFTFKFILNKKEKPIFSNKPITFPSMGIDMNIIIGPVLFGLGWGISGLCPGPAMCNIFLYLPQLTIFFSMLLLGQICAKYFIKWKNTLSINKNK